MINCTTYNAKHFDKSENKLNLLKINVLNNMFLQNNAETTIKGV